MLVDQGLDSRPVGVAVALLRSCGDRPDHAAGDTDKGVVIGIEGLRDQDLVSLVQNAGQGHLQRLAAAGGGVDVRLKRPPWSDFVISFTAAGNKKRP
ncbi:Uncharacterised protein [uncultured Blautia sp.]|nr:Uncharacterised protein [uncultured Blautia sp.]